MTASDMTRTVRLPILDRLIDADPKIRSEPLPTPTQSLRAMKEALRRDLESLLNTRRIIEQAPESCVELRRSVYSYGLPDISSMGLFSSADQNLLLKAIESAIAIFEPRLYQPKVSLRPVTEKSRTVHFVIEGLLRVDPEPEQVVFDTVLELSNCTYQIQGDTGAR